MQPIARYFAHKLKREFTRVIPKLRAELAQVPFAQHGLDYGVGGETFRAFRNWEHRPSDLYRTWAASVCAQLSPDILAEKLGSRRAFAQWHRSLVVDLQAHWFAHENHHLSFAHQYKLVDLFIKWMSRHDFGSPKIPVGFEAYAHCALDRQTLGKLNECLSLALPMPNPSMGDILADTTYFFCQDLIREFTTHCGGTPLLFDYFAWKRGG